MSLALRATVLVALLFGLGQPAAAAVPAASPAAHAVPYRVAPLSAVTSSASSVVAGMRILVRFHAAASDADIADAVHSVGGWIDSIIPALGVTRIALPGGSDDAVGDGPAVAAVLARHPAVASAEYDPIVRLSFTPTDTYWATDPVAGLGQWGLRKALVDQAWDKVRGAPTVTVATLDTGVDASHPDLQGVLVAGTVLISQPTAGCDVAARNDDNSHGTHVAGIIGAAGNNGAGIAGVAFGVKVMPLKVLDCTGVGSLSDVANGLVWAVDHGAKIVNFSLGSPFDSATLHAAVTYASTHNVLVVSAAGNCGTLTDRCANLNQLDYPAAYPEVLAVGATDTDDSVAFFSTRNASVDVAAPGRRIVSTVPTYATYLSRTANLPLNYTALSGTSQAAPLVSGLAALVWSGEPTLTAQQVFQRIESTADDLGVAGRDDAYGFGRVNALKAVSAKSATPTPPPAPVPAPPPPTARDSAIYTPAGTPSLPVLLPGGRGQIALVLTNNGTSTWLAAGDSPVHVAAHVSDARGNVVVWDGTRTTLPSDVLPGAKVGVFVSVDAPAAAGPYRAKVDLVREGVAWFSSLGVPTSDVDVLVAPDYRATLPASPLTVSRADPKATVTIRNDSIATWTTTGGSPVDVGVHWLDAAGNVLVWDGPRTPLAAPVGPNESVTLTVRLGPPPAGSAWVVIDLVSEGVAWFGQGPLRQVTLAP